MESRSVSGDPVLLSGGVDTFVARAVTELARMPSSLPRWSLMGGLAVMARLAHVHRETADVDIVSESSPVVVELLMDLGGSRTVNGVEMPSEVRIDILDVAEGGPDHGSFLAHRLGLDDASPVRVVVCDPGGVVIAEASPAVASAAALVAMKLHAIPERRDARVYKRASDLFDVYRLASLLRADVADGLRSAAPALQVSAVALLRRFFVDSPEQSIRWIRQAGRVPAMDELSADLLEIQGSALLRVLS